MRSSLSLLLALLVLSAATAACVELPAQAAPPGGPAFPPSQPPVPASGSAPSVEASAAAAAGTRYLSLVGSDFHPQESSTPFQYVSGGGLYTSNTLAPFVARLDLPQGATINDVIFFYVDNDIAQDINFWLVRYVPSGRIYTDIGYAQSNHSLVSANVQAAVLTLYDTTPVDNSQYAYQLQVRLNSGNLNHQIVGARVTYTVPTLSMAPIMK